MSPSIISTLTPSPSPLSAPIMPMRLMGNDSIIFDMSTPSGMIDDAL